MKTALYASYRESGQAWIGETPGHWTLKRIGQLFRQRSEKVSDKDYPALSVTKNGILPQLEHVAKTDDNDNRKLVKAGDFVINSRSDRKGSSGIAETDGSVSLINTVLALGDQLDRRFCHHLLRSYAFQEEFYRMGNGLVADLWSTNFNAMKAINLPVPPVDEQAAIARFLDRETARIDSLIEKKGRFIELLKEKRAAVITHAVTKGLDPNAPMKDSGSRWLGRMPEHWVVVPVKQMFESLDGKRIPLSSEERGKMLGEVPYYGASGIIDYVDRHIFDEDLILVSEDGANLEYRTYRIAFIARGKYWVNNHAHILRPKDGCLEYWSERLEAVDLMPYITGATQPKLTIENLMNIRVSMPPSVEERRAISDWILEQTPRIDTLIAKTERSIELLREKRSALITAAVTGKIDVRTAA